MKKKCLVSSGGLEPHRALGFRGCLTAGLCRILADASRPCPTLRSLAPRLRSDSTFNQANSLYHRWAVIAALLITSLTFQGCMHLLAYKIWKQTEGNGIVEREEIHMNNNLKAPFPYMGGKSKVAPEIWQRFGNVNCYIEPFFGSGAVLLGRPEDHNPRYELVNDLDGWLVNFWRSVKAAPNEVAEHAAWLCAETDLAARRDWLFSDTSFPEQLWRNPDFYDTRRAGIWAWGMSSVIGCNFSKKNCTKGDTVRRPSIKYAHPFGGVHSLPPDGMTKTEFLSAWIQRLARRIERVFVLCGDWKRAVADSVIKSHRNGSCAVLLDPPYIDRCAKVYNENGDVRADVRRWAIEHGHAIRVALCGYEGEYDMPGDWDVFAWKTNGGYGNQGNGNGRKNRERERIWFSPACAAKASPELALLSKDGPKHRARPFRFNPSTNSAPHIARSA